VKDSKDIRVVRVDAAKGEVIGEAVLLPYTDRLCLARDGKALYALSYGAPRGIKREGPVEGAVQVLDPRAMKVTRSVKVPTEPHDFDVTDQGVAFVSGVGSKQSEIVVVDVNQQKALLATWKGVPVSTCLKLSANGQQLYVTAWKLAPARVVSLGLPEPLANSELPKGEWTPAPPATVRGEVVVGPDGQYLLSESGVVFALSAAGKK
jgi:hypothetical protein